MNLRCLFDTNYAKILQMKRGVRLTKKRLNEPAMQARSVMRPKLSLHYFFDQGVVRDHSNKIARKILSPAIIAMILLLVSAIGSCFAYFSDIVSNTSEARSGCIQITPMLSIDNQNGNRSSAPDWNSSAICVPARYAQVESVHFSGPQYIDTGIDPTGNIKITVDFQVADTSSNHFIFGLRDGGTTGEGLSLWTWSDDKNTWGVTWGSAKNTTIAGTSALDRHKVVYDKGEVYFDGSNTPFITVTYPNTLTTTKSMFLGGLSEGGGLGLSKFVGDIYGFSIIKDEADVANYLPVYDRTVNQCGFYDTVSGDFKTADGLTCSTPNPKVQLSCDNLLCHGQDQGDTGLSVKPNTIHDFSYTLTNAGTVDYQNYTGDTISAWLDGDNWLPTEYIQFDGKSYINTGIDDSDDMTVNVDFETDANSTVNEWLLGTRVGILSNSYAVLLNFNDSKCPMNQSCFRGDFSNMQFYTAEGSLTPGDRYQLQLSNIGLAANLSVSGTPPVNVTADSAITTNYDLTLGALNANGTLDNPTVSTDGTFTGKIYSFSIDKDGTGSDINLTPVKNLATGECAMKDSITGKIYHNFGTTGTLTCPDSMVGPKTDTAITPKILLYSNATSDETIKSDIAALNGGDATAPNAIATIDGSTCSSTFMGNDSGISPVCQTGVLPDTPGVETNVGANQTYHYKFVVYLPDSAAANASIYNGIKVYFGVSSGAQGMTAQNWKELVHPYLSATLDPSNVATGIKYDFAYNGTDGLDGSAQTFTAPTKSSYLL